MQKEIKKHIIFWIGYFSFEVYIEYIWIKQDFKSLPWYQVLGIAILTESFLLLTKLPVAYMVAGNVNAIVERKGRIWVNLLRICLTYAIAVVVYVFFVFYIFYPEIYQLPVPENDHVTNRSISGFLDLTFAAGVFFAVFQYFQHQKWKLKEKELINQRVAAELNLIKSQTNPHFLFNTLNSLYALARKNSPDTQEGILKLSNLLRYLLYETSTNTVFISREIAIIQDYIELEQLRWGNKVDVRFTIGADFEDAVIIPSILLQLVENAFKHGAGESRFNSYIFIDLSCQDSLLKFSVRNSAEEPKLKSGDNLGLKNLKRLIDLSYSAYQFQCELLSNEFLVTLNIGLNEKSGVELHDRRG